MEFEKERNDIKKTLRLKFYSIGCSKAVLDRSTSHSTFHRNVIYLGVSHLLVEETEYP
jgi:hypothetical protein